MGAMIYVKLTMKKIFLLNNVLLRANILNIIGYWKKSR